MLVFGVLLVACFVAPWAVGGETTVFAWSILSAKAPLAAKLLPIMLAATGAIAVALGTLKLSGSTRAFAATGLGLAPILFQIIQSDISWQSLATVIGGLVLVTGLILRSRYFESQLSRILVTLGVLLLLAVYLVPVGGALPIKGLFTQLADLPGKAKVIPIVSQLIPLVLALLALVAWLAKPSRVGTHILAWTVLFWGLAASVTTLLLSEDIVASLKGGLSVFFYLPLAQAAWMSLACFGIAGVIGDQFES
jgi:hypothetical protein